MAFDPSLKKKKKKKKAFDLDAALAEDGSAAPAAPAGEEVAVAKPVKVKQASEENVPAFDEADADRAAEKAGRKAEALNMDDLDLDNLDSFGDKKKKKKKKRKGDVDGILDGADGAGAEGGDENQENQASKGGKEDGKTEKKSSATGGSGDPWTGSDRDYTYDELLKRVFTIIQEKNPEMQARHTKGFVMRPPQVVRSGTKKTAFVNFMDIAKALHRQPKHLLAFLQAELGTVHHRRFKPVDPQGQIPTEEYRNRAPEIHQRVRVLPHLPFPGHHPEQGRPNLFPPVHDLPFQVFSPVHQDRFPGRHWEAVGHAGKERVVGTLLTHSVFMIKISHIYVYLLSSQL